MTVIAADSLVPTMCVEDKSQSSPIILHAPHGSRFIPDWHRPSFVVSPAELDRELDRMTDAHTDDIVRSINGPSSIVAGLSRVVVDVERFPDEREEMLTVGMGAFYTHGSQRQHLRTIRDEHRAALTTYFDAYAAAFTDLVQATLDAHGRAFIIDVHSFPVDALPYELHSSARRPQLDLGTDPVHTCQALLEGAKRAFKRLDIDLNSPFAGTYVPLRFYGTTPQVQSLMLELRRDVVAISRGRLVEELDALCSALLSL